MAAAAAGWSYEPLLDATRQIRLLRVQQGSERLNFTLEIHNLDAAPAYNAISYIAGDRPTKKRITINGMSLAIGANCHDALLQAIPHDPHTPLWVDSVCINPADLSEMNAQLAIMGSIFSNARRVFAYLGSETQHGQ